MGHKNVEQIIRLIKRCKTKDTDVFVHLDINMGEIPSTMKVDGVYFTSKRLHGELDRFSLVEIALELCKTAKSVDQYFYYALLSGQDYPICNMERIMEQLTKVYPKPYIDCTPYDKKNWVYHKFTQNRFTTKLGNYISTLENKLFKFLLIKIRSLLVKTTWVFKCSYYHKLRKMDISLYGGSAWWILPNIIIDFILQQSEEKKPYVRILLNTYTPEETYFQILSMRSPLKELVEINSLEIVGQNCKTYAYFNGKDKPFKGHPYIFTMNEIDLLLKKCNLYYFARKFDIEVDEDIVNWIDYNLLKPRN